MSCAVRGTEENKSTGKKNNSARKIEEYAVWLSLVFCGLYWILDSLVNAFIFDIGSISGQIFSPNTQTIWTRTLVSFILISSGALAQSIAYKRMKVERALRFSEEKYSSLFQNCSEAIFIHDLQGRIQDANQKGLLILGYTKQELTGMRIADIHPPSAKESSKKAFEIIARDGFVHFETEFLRKNGGVFSAEVSASLFKIDGTDVIQGIVRDITERRLMEEALQESQEKFRAISEQTLTGIGILQDSVFMFVNQAVANMTGYSMDAMLSWGPEEFRKSVYPEDSRFMMDQARKNQLDRRGAARSYIFRILHKSGEIKKVRMHSQTITYKYRPADFFTLVEIPDSQKSRESSEFSARKIKS